MNREGTRGRGATATVTLALCLLPLALTVTGCTRDFKYQPLGMWNGSRLKPMEGGPHGGPSMATRPPVPGTVARGQLRDDDPIRTGRAGGKLLTTSPLPVTAATLQRGQERYNVFCAPCHSRTGDGEGMIVKRSFPHPPDYATPRLRRAPIGHFYDVITNGYGVMYSYAERVPPTDRWAIAAYIRVLQRARPVVTQDLYEQQREKARQEGITDPTRGMRVPSNQPGIVNPT
ncbi:MAG TPA: cytochrome c, partial [Armatimonadota bacterium]|nr:cytochrome c [Armatimonadota bacterium]